MRTSPKKFYQNDDEPNEAQVIRTLAERIVEFTSTRSLPCRFPDDLRRERASLSRPNRRVLLEEIRNLGFTSYYENENMWIDTIENRQQVLNPQNSSENDNESTQEVEENSTPTNNTVRQLTNVEHCNQVLYQSSQNDPREEEGGLEEESTENVVRELSYDLVTFALNNISSLPCHFSQELRERRAQLDSNERRLLLSLVRMGGFTTYYEDNNMWIDTTENRNQTLNNNQTRNEDENTQSNDSINTVESLRDAIVEFASSNQESLPIPVREDLVSVRERCSREQRRSLLEKVRERGFTTYVENNIFHVDTLPHRNMILSQRREQRQRNEERCLLNFLMVVCATFLSVSAITGLIGYFLGI